MQYFWAGSTNFLFPFWAKKPAPGIPGTVLLEPYGSSPKLSGGRTEGVEIVFRAADADGQEAAEVQTEHSNEALAVDPAVPAPYQDGEGLHGGQRYELANFLKGVDGDVKFPHQYPSDAVQTTIFRL